MYHLYILECADGTLYTGITTDLQRRVKEHNSSQTGAKYTKCRRPVRLVYSERIGDRARAQTQEARVKSLSRREKLDLIKQNTGVADE